MNTSTAAGTGPLAGKVARRETAIPAVHAAGRWVVLAAPVGCFDEERHANLGRTDASPAYIRRAVEGSLRRLGTDRIDLYQLHVWEHPPEQAGEVVEVLEELVRQGKIRTYGWSTDVKAGVEAFARGPHCGAAQILANVFESNDRLIAFGEGEGLALLCRSPLAMGLLSGQYTRIGRCSPRAPEGQGRVRWGPRARGPCHGLVDGKRSPRYFSSRPGSPTQGLRKR